MEESRNYVLFVSLCYLFGEREKKKKKKKYLFSIPQRDFYLIDALSWLCVHQNTCNASYALLV